MYYYLDSYLKNLTQTENEALENRFRDWGLQQLSFYERLDRWFQNFESYTDKQLAHKLILNIDFFNPSIVDERIKQLFIPVKEYLNLNNKTEFDILIAIPDELGDSAVKSSYDILKLWNLTQDQIFTIQNLRKQYLEGKVVVFFNDTHGTGNQFTTHVVPKIKDINCKIFILCLTITTEALDNFQKQNIEVTIIPQTPSKSAFDIFTKEEIIRLTELGRLVYSKHPLGYGNVGLLTAYYYQCPNNTLPIIWANGVNNIVNGYSYKWSPLFEYRAKRNPREIVNHQIWNLQKRLEKSLIVSETGHNNESIVPLQTVYTPKLDLLPSKLILDIAREKKLEVAKNLEVIYQNHRDEYRKNGNPILMYNKVAAFLYTLEELLPDSTIQIAKFHWFLSYLLINSDYDTEVLGQARTHAQMAINILENTNLYDKEIHNQLVKSYWLKILSYKMQGHLSEAHRMITDTIADFNKDNLGNYSDTLYLHRQKTLIEEEKDSYDNLLLGMEKYKFNSIESYYTSKRIFEFTLNTKNQKDYEKYFRLSRMYYNKAAPFLEQVYKFSYWKYLYIYFMYTKKHDIADRIFSNLLKGSQEKQLYGQQRSLHALKELFNND